MSEKYQNICHVRNNVRIRVKKKVRAHVNKAVKGCVAVRVTQGKLRIFLLPVPKFSGESQTTPPFAFELWNEGSRFREEFVEVCTLLTSCKFAFVC